MSSYVIAIGGTGARCLESLIHLCAIGLGPNKLFILILDPDDAHGNIERLRDVITKYQKCRTSLQLGPQQLPLFKTEVEYSIDKNRDHLNWSPVFEEKNLRSYYQFDTLRSAEKGSEQRILADIVKLLYSQDEIDLEWDQGFRGRSSVGAPVMARIKEHFKEKPWSDLIQAVKNDLGSGNDARLFVLASIFGATGASGFPTVGHILREESKDWLNNSRFLMGGALLLPYFSFPIPADHPGVFATPDNFLVNTKAALKHYSFIWKDKSPYEAMYLIGERHQEMEGRDFGLGGKLQANVSHYSELLAALSAVDFYKRHLNRDAHLQFYAARAREEVVDWRDLPHADLKREMLIFTTLAFAFRTFYWPLLRDEKFDANRQLFPWYVDHFLNNSLSLTNDVAKEHQDNFNSYLQTYLQWLLEIHSSTALKLRLINPQALNSSKERSFQTLTDEEFKMLLYSDLKDKAGKYEPGVSHGLDNVWERLCTTKPAQIASPTGRFVYMLYRAVEQFCQVNYQLPLEEDA